MRLIILILIWILGGCSNDTDTFNSNKFLDELAKTQLKFSIMENDQKDQFFSVVPVVIDVDGEYILVYEYANQEEMEKEASTIHENGNIGSASITYVSAPHYYKKGSIIVQYVGKNGRIIESLNKIIGIQFAGR
jgi:hypothetical protein